MGRFVDRDMVMRYHWGLGIGHKYSWSVPPESSSEDPLPLLNLQEPPSIQPVLQQANFEGESYYQAHPEVTPTHNEAHGTSSRIDDGQPLEDLHFCSGDEIEPETTSLSDGLEDLENEDLGDSDWSDE